MKTLALTAAALLTATAVSAAEIGNTGISVGAELDTYYDFDAEGTMSVFTPTVGYNAWGVDLYATTDLSVVDNNTIVVDKMFNDVVLEFGAGYTLGQMGPASATAYGEVFYDVDGGDTTGAKVGVKFAF